MNYALKIFGILFIQIVVLVVMAFVFEAINMKQYHIGYFSGSANIVIAIYLFKRYIKD